MCITSQGTPAPNALPFKTLSPAKPAAEIKRESEDDEAEVIDTQPIGKGEQYDVKRGSEIISLRSD